MVKVEKNEQETTGGLLIAATAKKADKPSIGEVAAVGPGRVAMNGELIDMETGIGDMVKFRDFSGNEVTIGDDTFSIIRMQECLAKF